MVKTVIGLTKCLFKERKVISAVAQIARQTIVIAYSHVVRLFSAVKKSLQRLDSLLASR
ncbi:hypothetical protein D3C73_738730 [compost metagenome]